MLPLKKKKKRKEGRKEKAQRREKELPQCEILEIKGLPRSFTT